jgi:hypothetical protein
MEWVKCDDGEEMEREKEREKEKGWWVWIGEGWRGGMERNG